MSIKRRIQSQYRNLLHSIYTLRLPVWLICKTTRIILLLAIIIFGSAYIIKTASSASSGYQIYDLENKTQALTSDIKKVEIQIADYSSMSSIQSRLRGSGLVLVSQYQYYNPEEKAVAKR